MLLEHQRYAASLKAIANLIGWPDTMFYPDDILDVSAVSIYEKKPLLSESFKMIQTDYLSSPESLSVCLHCT